MSLAKQASIIIVFLSSLAYFTVAGGSEFIDLDGVQSIEDFEPPEETFLDIDTDGELKENVEIYNFTEVDPDYQEYSIGLGLTENSETGTVTYDMRDYDEWELRSTPPQGLFQTCNIELVTYDASGSETSSGDGCREPQELPGIDEEADFIELTFTEEEWYLYEVKGVTGENPSLTDIASLVWELSSDNTAVTLMILVPTSIFFIIAIVLVVRGVS